MIYRPHRKTALLSALIALLVSSAYVHADGPRDNQPDNVRRVPRLGIEVPAEQRARLQEELDQLRESIDALQASEGEYPELRERLPDVEVLFRAVRDALEYQEFFKEREIDDGFKLLERARNRALSLAVGSGCCVAGWSVPVGA